MVERFRHIEDILNTFIETEQLIHFTFDRIIGTATERRDEFLAKLSGIKMDYLKKEETRNKHTLEIEKMIEELNHIDIEQVPIIELRKERVKNLKKEEKKYQKPTPVPVLAICFDGLESLLGMLSRFVRFEEVGEFYRDKVDPVAVYIRDRNKRIQTSPFVFAINKDDSIYIADAKNSNIQIYSAACKFLTEFGKGHLSSPNSIALSDQWVFVGDYIHNAIFKFNLQNNKFVCQSVKGVLNTPHGITVDTNGELLVSDCINDRIAVLNSGLTFVRQIGKGRLISPRDVKVNNNNIYVADNNAINNIHIFTKFGVLVRSFIKLDDGTGSINLCFDNFQNLIVADYCKKSIQIFTNKGQLIHRITCHTNPSSIVINKCNGVILCACIDGVTYMY